VSMHVSAPARARAWAIGVAAALVAAWRAYECLALPVETGDIARNVLYGALAAQHGFAVAAHALTDLSGAWADISWARFPYSYPPVTLAFFTFVASVSPTIFAAKACLTALEAANAWMLARLGRNAWLGLAYWASPLSIWWVSREGQFEPLQNAFSLLALLLAGSLPLLAGVALALAISVKLTAAALLPWFALRLWRAGRRAAWLGLGGIALGFVPCVAAEFAWHGVSNVFRYGSLLTYNPYYWNPFADMFAWNTPLQVAADEFASYGMLAVLLLACVRARDLAARAGFLAPIAFLVFCKLHGNVQFWYFLLLPTFLATVPDRRLRFALIALCPLLDLRGSAEALLGPFDQRTFHGLPSVFDRYGG